MNTNKIIRAIGAAYGNDNPQELTDDLLKGDIVAEVFSDESISVSEVLHAHDRSTVGSPTYLIYRPVKLPTAQGSVIRDTVGFMYLRGSIYWVDEVGCAQTEAEMNAILSSGGKILFDAGDVK